MCLGGQPCELPDCRVRAAGTGGIGRPKANPASAALTPRERAYKAAHPRCEVAWCGKPTEHLHHIDRRRTKADRETSRLLAVCAAHHRDIHNGGSTMAAKPRRTRRIRMTNRKGQPVFIAVKFNRELAEHYRNITERRPIVRAEKAA